MRLEVLTTAQHATHPDDWLILATMTNRGEVVDYQATHSPLSPMVSN